MANPRYLTSDGTAQVELLKKLSMAKAVYYGQLRKFCKKHCISAKELSAVERVFLIGSHAEEKGWSNDTSDLDLKLINSTAIPENLWRYKREVLDPTLCDRDKDKKYWIDLYFAREDYQVLNPKWDLTRYWGQDI